VIGAEIKNNLKEYFVFYQQLKAEKGLTIV